MTSELLEKLAELEHEQWIHWMNYQNEKIHPITDMTVDEWYKQQETWQRWMKLAKTPYNELTEKEKKSDREWARKVLAILKREPSPQTQEMQKLLEERGWCKASELDGWFRKFKPKLEALLADHVSRRKLIKKLREIRDSPQNLSLDKGHDMVPDLIKELLEMLTKKGDTKQ